LVSCVKAVDLRLCMIGNYVRGSEIDFSFNRITDT